MYLTIIGLGVSVGVLISAAVTVTFTGWWFRVLAVILLIIGVSIPFVVHHDLEQRELCHDMGGVYVNGHCLARTTP